MTNENMRVIPVPQDVIKYENKVAYGFTLRQLVVIVLTLVVDGTLVYYLYFKYPGERTFQTELSIEMEKKEPKVPEVKKKKKRNRS